MYSHLSHALYKTSILAVFGLVLLFNFYEKAHASAFEIPYTIVSSSQIRLMLPSVFESGQGAGQIDYTLISGGGLCSWGALSLGGGNTYGELLAFCLTASTSNWRADDNSILFHLTSFVGTTTGFFHASTSNSNTFPDHYIFSVDFTDGVIDAPANNNTNSTYDEYINIVSPINSQTTSTTVPIEIDYMSPFSLDARPTTTISYSITDAVTSELQYYYSQDFAPNTSVNITLNHNVDLPDGSKFIRAEFRESLSGAEVAQSKEVFFNVNVNTYYLATGLASPYNSAGKLSQIDCDTFDVGCQVQKAMTFLFKPNPTSLNDVGQSWQAILMKKPFGYVTVTITQLKSLSSTSTPTFSLGTIPFKDAIFDPFDLALSGILWSLFFIAWYRFRLRHLDV